MLSKLLKTLACVWVVVACTQDEPSARPVGADNILPQVYAVNYPLAYFAERIGGESINVIFPAPPDVDPAYWSPAPAIVADYQQAELVLLNGAGYASWVQRATLSSSRLVDTTAALADKLISVDDNVTHSHGPTGDHSHQNMAFTTWLNMELAIGQARGVFNSLVGLLPEMETEFREHLNQLEKELGDLDMRLKLVAERIDDQPLLFSHPVYQYLIHRYRLNGRSVHWEPQEMPADEQWRELDSLLKTHAATWMIWEDEPRPDVASRLQSMGVNSLVFGPCRNRPAQGDFLSVMQENVRVLGQAFPVATAPLRDAS
jgi:zinc transport system substrate-binding protein